MELKCRRLSSTATLQLTDRDDSAPLATILNNLARHWQHFRLLIATIHLRWQRFRSPIIGDALGRQSQRFSSVGDDLARRWWRFRSSIVGDASIRDASSNAWVSLVFLSFAFSFLFLFCLIILPWWWQFFSFSFLVKLYCVWLLRKYGKRKNVGNSLFLMVLGDI